MPGRDDSDPLAETAAAPPGPLDATATSAASATAAPEVRGTPKAIGRYQITAILGQGAMGVVYAAHDTDLDRTIALKVLRSGDSDAARARLLREARAMAKLSHPAVVTVYEVGTAGGVDYVAMELIDGTTLAEWIATARPSQADILDAFETAGRGLAAAHAATIIHRDFKPHNVLRSKRGRVVVTDFGLARHTYEQLEHAPAPGNKDAGSLSSTLTATGAVLGTPAYMAPEQHDGTEIGPAADQFAYCVALWEALAGARPFPGHTLAQVRAHIDRGPDAATEAKLPRRLRPILRRGLSVKPAARYSNMDALLAAIGKRSRRIAVVLAAAGVAVLGAGGAVLALRPSEPAAIAPLPGCAGTAEAELATFTGAPARRTLGGLTAPLDALGRDWLAAHREICAKPEQPDHAVRVTCLRAVRQDLEIAVDALAALPGAERAIADVVNLASDPRACTAATPPTRKLLDGPRLLALRTAELGDRRRREAVPEPEAAAACLRAEWLMSKLHDFERLRHAKAKQLVAAATEAGQACGDDRTTASLALIAFASDFGRMMNEQQMSTIVARSGGDRLLGVIGMMIEGLGASFRHDTDRAIARMREAVNGARGLGMRLVMVQCSYRLSSWLKARGEPGDVAEATRLLREVAALPIAPVWRTTIQHELIESLQLEGNVRDAVAIAATVDDRLEPPADAIAITGRVRDEAGKPLAGARVVAQRRIVVYPEQLDPSAPAYATAVTAADGTFAIRGAPVNALVMAAHGDRRTRAVPLAKTVELRLVPTGSVTGTVERVGDKLGTIVIVASPIDRPGVEYTVPLQPDGTWRIDHVPRGKTRVVAVFGATQQETRFQDVVVPSTKPVVFELAHGTGSTLHVILRSEAQAAISLGLVYLIRGKASAKVLEELEAITAPMTRARAFTRPVSDADPAVRDRLDVGDVAVRIDAVEPGELTLCAVGISGEISDLQYMNRVEKHSRTLAVACKPITVAKPTEVFEVLVPPMKRLPD